MVGQIIDIIQEYGWKATGVIALLGIFIQISPIKINPLSWIGKQIIRGLRWVGKQMTNEIADRMDKLEKDLQMVKDNADQKRIKDLRWQILDFANSAKKLTYQRESYDHIYALHEEYEDLLKKYGMTNGKVTRAMEIIDRTYEERTNDSDF